MGILFWYTLRQQGRIFFLCLAGFLTLYLVVEFFEELQKFLRHDTKPSVILAFFFFKIPDIFFKMAPLAVLTTTLLTLGILSKNREVMAMRSCGIAPSQLMFPFLAFGLATSLILLSFTAVIIPLSNIKAKYIMAVLIKKQPRPMTFQSEQLWLRIRKDVLLHVGRVEPDGSVLRAIRLYQLDPDFRLNKLTDAPLARYHDQLWLLEGASQRSIQANGSVATTAIREALPLNLSLSPQDFRTWLSLEPDNMTLNELALYIDRLQRDGHNTSRYLTDYWGRIAFSFVCLIMTIVGIAVGLRQMGSRSTSIAKGIGASLVIGFLYWAAHSAGVALGRSGAMTPLLGGWIANIIFLSISLNLFLKVRY